MGARSLEMWAEFERAHGVELVRRCGVLWMEALPSEENRASLKIMDALGVRHETLTREQLRRVYPQINSEGFEYAILEHGAGYAFARRSNRTAAEIFEREGGVSVRAGVLPLRDERGSLKGVALDNGARLEADAFVFACGPWLPKVLPEALGKAIRPTRQELFYFGEPSGGAFSDAAMPAWIDHSEHVWYGIPGNEFRGFKVGDDNRGPDTDPTTQDRLPTAPFIEATRAYAGFRFPALANAPITEARVCQYENTPDNDFIIDRHPTLDNVWIAGGGSGHGFKHGPAIGEHVRDLIAGRATVRPEFSLARF
jgi:glycine/D-amino acid oxidase-like deaminating enzyme